MKYFTTGNELFLQEVINGVYLFLLKILTSAPFSNNSLTISKFPLNNGYTKGSPSIFIHTIYIKGLTIFKLQLMKEYIRILSIFFLLDMFPIIPHFNYFLLLSLLLLLLSSFTVLNSFFFFKNR